MNGPVWRPQAIKLQFYEEIFNLNRAFHLTLLSLERLEQLGFFRSEYLNASKIELEHTRANTNDELIETLRQHELDEAGRFDQMRREWKDQFKDPDDVFLKAAQRREQIKEKMKNLQHSLERLKVTKQKRKSNAKKRSR